jgi:hypothetical protein
MPSPPKNATTLATATALALAVTLFQGRGKIFKPITIRTESTEKGENKKEK